MAKQPKDVGPGPPFACPCCGCLTLPERGGYDICHVCFWEDDGAAEKYANRPSGCNAGMTLTGARKNFAAFGACDWQFRSLVSPPTPEEIPPGDTRFQAQANPGAGVDDTIDEADEGD